MDENVHSDGDDDCNDSILVELNDENACPTSKSVTVHTVSENTHKGKNMSELPEKIALSKASHFPMPKQNSKNKKMTK